MATDASVNDDSATVPPAAPARRRSGSMWRYVTPAIILVVVVAVVVWRTSKPTPEQILDAAIAAQGGAEALAHPKAVIWDEFGTDYLYTEPLTYSARVAHHGLNRYRFDVIDRFTVAVNGDRGWRKRGGRIEDLTAEQIAGPEEARYRTFIYALLPLKEPGYTLTPVDEIKVPGGRAVGFTVSQEGHDDVTLYFDNETYLPARVIRKAKLPGQGDREFTQELTLYGYKTVGGIKFFTRYTIAYNGQLATEAEISNIKVLDQLDDSLFEKPQ